MFREDGGEEKFYSWFNNRVGAIICFPNFLSSSMRRWPNHNCYLEIATSTNSNGKYIGFLTNKEDLEQEVTFLPNSKFLITSVDQANYTVHLEEVPSDQECNYILGSSYMRKYRDKPGEN